MHVLDADEHALAVERLLEEVGGAELDGRDRVVHRGVSADDDDRHLARGLVLAEPLERFEPADAGQLHVEDGEIDRGVRVREDLQRLFGALRLDDLVALRRAAPARACGGCSSRRRRRAPAAGWARHRLAAVRRSFPTEALERSGYFPWRSISSRKFLAVLENGAAGYLASISLKTARASAGLCILRYVSPSRTSASGFEPRPDVGLEDVLGARHRGVELAPLQVILSDVELVPHEPPGHHRKHVFGLPGIAVRRVVFDEARELSVRLGTGRLITFFEGGQEKPAVADLVEQRLADAETRVGDLGIGPMIVDEAAVSLNGIGELLGCDVGVGEPQLGEARITAVAVLLLQLLERGSRAFSQSCSSNAPMAFS